MSTPTPDYHVGDANIILCWELNIIAYEIRLNEHKYSFIYNCMHT